MRAPKFICRSGHLGRRPKISVLRSNDFSTAAVQPSVEHVRVPCGSNGSVQLRIHGIRGAVSAVPPPVILCLSGAPLIQRAAAGHGAADFFARRMPAIAVEISYRTGPNYQYPTPLHDMMFGYDWVLKHLVPNRSSIAPGIPDHSPARIGVYGEGLGGGLAATLALTECHTKGHRIAAATVHEPLLNWLAPEELALANEDTDTGKGKRKKNLAKSEVNIDDANLTTQLVSFRREAFRKPEQWFDPFMSPMLFFRSSNVPIPREDPSSPVDEFAELARLDQEDFMRQQLRLSSMSLSDAMSDITISPETSADTLREETQPASPRKSARRYPRIDSGLTLPNFRITTGHSRLWYEQAYEFTTCLRRSMVRTDELKKRDMAMAELHAEERAIHEVYGQSMSLEERLSDAVNWFGAVI